MFVFGRWFDPPASKFNSATQTQWDIFDTKIFKGKSVPFLLAEPKLPLAGGGSCFSKKRRSWIMIFSLVVVLFSKYIYTGKRRVLNCIWILLTSIYFSNLAAINSFYIYFSLVFFQDFFCVLDLSVLLAVLPQIDMEIAFLLRTLTIVNSSIY